MSQIFKFTAAALPSGKKGISKPDSDGYHSLIVGGLNIFNSMGQYYALEGAKELFEQSSTFMRRIQRGAVRGEVGHPRPDPGMSTEAFINRLFEIRETNVCCQFKEVSLDLNWGNTHNQPGVVATIAKLIPSGPHGVALEKALLNPSENVFFSVRGLTDDFFQNGRYTRVLRQIIGWDWVSEPGIAIAEKYKSPATEDYNLVLEDMSNTVVNADILSGLLAHQSEYALEHTRENIQEALQLIRPQTKNHHQVLKSW
jgi:hypothetical protein